jgi:hypothetical protein
MSAPKITSVGRLVPIAPKTARRLGLEVRPWPAGSGIYVDDVWLEVPLEGDKRWVVAYRVVVQNGRAIVAEIRVFPNEPDRETAGEWSGQSLGAKAAVPAGGLSTRALRSIRLGHDVHSLKKLEDYFRSNRPEDVQRLLESFGLDGIRSNGQTARASGGRGRPALPREEYARLASAYADAVGRGSRNPIRELAQQLGLPATRIRARIHRARELGFLDPGSQGSAGGHLMPAARRALKGARYGKTTRTR